MSHNARFRCRSSARYRDSPRTGWAWMERCRCTLSHVGLEQVPLRRGMSHVSCLQSCVPLPQASPLLPYQKGTNLYQTSCRLQHLYFPVTEQGEQGDPGYQGYQGYPGYPDPPLWKNPSSPVSASLPPLFPLFHQIPPTEDRTRHHPQVRCYPVPVRLPCYGEWRRWLGHTWSKRHVRTPMIIMLPPCRQQPSQVVFRQGDHAIHAFPL